MPAVLLVEDNEMNRDMLSRRLLRRGYDVHTADDGHAGVRQARELMPDLIIMDLSLPGVDGWQATRLLKDDEATSAIPIIILTAHVLSGDRDQAMAAGCDDYDVKPVDFNRLVEKIERLL